MQTETTSLGVASINIHQHPAHPTSGKTSALNLAILHPSCFYLNVDIYYFKCLIFYEMKTNVSMNLEQILKQMRVNNGCLNGRPRPPGILHSKSICKFQFWDVDSSSTISHSDYIAVLKKRKMYRFVILCSAFPLRTI